MTGDPSSQASDDENRATVRRLTALVERYTASLDDGGYDRAWAHALFTEDVVLEYPVGRHDGRDGVEEFITEVMKRWSRTHHHTSNYLVDVVGDRAELRWSVIASHVHPGQDESQLTAEPFQLGGWFTGTAVDTPDGWRFSRMCLQIAWTRGTPVVDLDTIDAVAARR